MKGKKYWFSLNKHGHDLFFRMNRLKNTVDDILTGKDPVNWNEIDLMETEIRELQEILTLGCGCGAVQLSCHLYAVAKNASVWASNTRANTCIENGRPDLVQYC